MTDDSLKKIIKCIHSTKGRLRFRLTASAISTYMNLDAEHKEALNEKQGEMHERAESIRGVTSVRINKIIASITILYNPQVTTEAAVKISLNSLVKEYYPS